MFLDNKQSIIIINIKIKTRRITHDMTGHELVSTTDSSESQRQTLVQVKS